MKRAVLCVPDPQNYLDYLDDHSVMVINPAYTDARKQYLLEKSDWSLLIDHNGQHYRNGADYGDERLFWYTSGTVGDSKFYSFSQQQLDALTDSIVKDLEITTNDRYVGVMSLWHAHGQSLYWATRRVGCETHFLSVREIRQMAKLQPTFVSAIPDILNAIQQLPLNSLRFIRSGSAPLSQELYQALTNKFQIPVVEYFGMTEAMSHVLSNPLHGPQRPGTVGVPTRGVEAKIIDEHLWIRSSQAYTTDWFDTGDLASQDNHGYYQIKGRSVDRINIRGYKIDPVSVEQQLKHNLPDIEQCVIFGNSSVNCIYTGSVDSQLVIENLQKLHSSCFPSLVLKVDTVPLGDSGKVSRKWLVKYFDCK